jgi:hypothetical protein
MTIRTIVWVGFATLLLAAPLSAGEKQPCTGDCDTDDNVIVSEIVLATSIGLGTQPRTRCEAADPGGDGVGPDDLVTAVLNSLTVCGTLPPPTATDTPSVTPTPSLTPTGVLPTSTPTGSPTPTNTEGPPLCGNGRVEGDETCDDRGVCTSVGDVQRCIENGECPSGQTCGINGFCLCATNANCPSGQECSDEGFCFMPCTGPDQCPTGECRPTSGDGCAANCTMETRRPGTFIPCEAGVSCSTSGPDCAGSCVQSIVLPVPVVLNGTTALITGEMRDDEVMGPEGQVVTNPGEVPVVIKATDTAFVPTSVFGTICACVKPVPNPLFGPGNSGGGVVGCGQQGLVDIDFLVEQDHNTTPGSPGNGGGFPDDLECDDSIPTEGVASLACREREDAACEEDRFLHPGVCNSPRKITFSGGRKPRGSILIFNSTAITQLSDGGACTAGTPGACPFPDYGPDCVPCTRDDTPEVVVNVTPTTSGKATVRILDANNRAGAQPLEPGATCGGTPCKVEETGELVDCDMLEGNDSLGGVLATAFPGIDSMTLMDTISTTTLAAGSPARQ